MPETVTIKYGGGIYTCAPSSAAPGALRLAAKPGQTTYVALGAVTCEESVQRWFGNYGLRRRLARRLLDAAIRGTGPFADVRHPRRVAT